MALSASTTLKSAPIVAALSLACASFREGSRAFADETPLKTVPGSAEVGKQFDRSDLQRIASFAHLLARHESLLPALDDRPRVFNVLAVEGVLSQLNLHPMERAAIEHLATTDAATLSVSILTTRARTKNSFSFRDMFGSVETTTSSSPPLTSDDLTKGEMTQYAHALILCHLISGHIATTSPNGTTKPEEIYLSAQPVEHHVRLLQTIGALELTKSVEPTSMAARIGRTFLTKVSNCS